MTPAAIPPQASHVTVDKEAETRSRIAVTPSSPIPVTPTTVSQPNPTVAAATSDPTTDVSASVTTVNTAAGMSHDNDVVRVVTIDAMSDTGTTTARTANVRHSSSRNPLIGVAETTSLASSNGAA